MGKYLCSRILTAPAQVSGSGSGSGSGSESCPWPRCFPAALYLATLFSASLFSATLIFDICFWFPSSCSCALSLLCSYDLAGTVFAHALSKILFPSVRSEATALSLAFACSLVLVTDLCSRILTAPAQIPARLSDTALPFNWFRSARPVQAPVTSPPATPAPGQPRLSRRDDKG